MITFIAELNAFSCRASKDSKSHKPGTQAPFVMTACKTSSCPGVSRLVMLHVNHGRTYLAPTARGQEQSSWSRTRSYTARCESKGEFSQARDGCRKERS